MTDVTIDIGATIDKLVQAVDGATGQLGRLTSVFGSVGEAAAKMGELIGIGLSVEGIVHLAESMGELGLQAERMEASLGINATQLSFLKGLAAESGVSIDTLALSIERISLNIQRGTKDAFSPVNAALKVLGLTAQDFVGLQTDQYFLKLAEAVSKLEPSLNRTNAVMAIGGRGVQQIIQTLALGSDEIEKFAARWQAAGSGIDVAKFASTHQELALLERATQSISVVIFNSLQPAINGMISALGTFVIWVREAITQGGSLSKVLDFIGFAGKVAATALAGMLAVVQGLAESIAALFSLTLGDIEQFQQNAQKATDNFEKIAQNLKKVLQDIWATPITVHPPDPTQAAAAMNLTAKLAADMQRIALEAQRAGLQQQLKQTTDTLGFQLSLERINADQRIAATAVATEQVYQQEVALLEKEKALYPQRSQEWAKINADIVKLQQKHNTEMQALNQQEIVAIKDKYMSVLSSIQSAWDSQLQGLLAGTTTWAQAFKNILSQLAIEFAKWVEKKILVYVAGEAAETTAAASGAASRTAAAAGEAAATTAVKKASMIGSILASAQETFAGVFAFLSPLMGPAAVGPAAASEGLVAAQAALPSFDTGAYNLPYDMVAQVHAGEMIIPASQADSIRSGAGGGVNVNISTLDTQSMATWIRNNAGTLATAVGAYQTNNPSARPRY